MPKKKIVFIMNNFLVGGVERLLFDVISFLDREKYDIKIVTVLGSGPLEDSFRKLGVSIYFAGFSSRKLPFKLYWILIAPITLLRLTFFLLKGKPDVVVTSLYQADVLGMIAAKIVGVKKRILIQHDNVQFRKVICVVKKIFALGYATQIVAISETVKNFLVEYFKVENKKIKTIFNGVDYDIFRKGRRMNLDLNTPVVGIVGRLEEVKGHIYALRALKILKEQHGLSPAVLLAGSGTLRYDLEKYVSENNLDFVKFLGNVDNVSNFLSQVDVLIVPSIDEGFGLVVLEGMISGKVMIASDIKVMRELIKDGENGILFKSQDPESLSNVMHNVLTDKGMREKLQENTLLFIEREKSLFDIKEVSKTYQNLFFSR